MLAVAHKTPSDSGDCRWLAAIGVTVFEIDVRLRDDRLVASHYLPLFPHVEFVQRHNWRLRFGGDRTLDPSVSDLASAVPSGCRILLDCKDDTGAGARRLSERLRERVGDAERYVVASKNWPALQPLLTAGYDVWASAASSRAVAELLSREVPCTAVTARHTLLGPDVMRRLKSRYPTVVAWTVNDVTRVERLADMGVDGIASDKSVVLQAIAQRGTGAPDTDPPGS